MNINKECRQTIYLQKYKCYQIQSRKSKMFNNALKEFFLSKDCQYYDSIIKISLNAKNYFLYKNEKCLNCLRDFELCFHLLMARLNFS